MAQVVELQTVAVVADQAVVQADMVEQLVLNQPAPETMVEMVVRGLGQFLLLQV